MQCQESPSLQFLRLHLIEVKSAEIVRIPVGFLELANLWKAFSLGQHMGMMPGIEGREAIHSNTLL